MRWWKNKSDNKESYEQAEKRKTVKATYLRAVQLLRSVRTNEKKSQEAGHDIFRANQRCTHTSA